MARPRIVDPTLVEEVNAIPEMNTKENRARALTDKLHMTLGKHQTHAEIAKANIEGLW
jgi:hypothetical protein